MLSQGKRSSGSSLMLLRTCALFRVVCLRLLLAGSVPCLRYFEETWEDIEVDPLRALVRWNRQQTVGLAVPDLLAKPLKLWGRAKTFHFPEDTMQQFRRILNDDLRKVDVSDC